MDRAIACPAERAGTCSTNEACHRETNIGRVKDTQKKPTGKRKVKKRKARQAAKRRTTRKKR
jgi:hypothetical protein